jgi:hypothetical protein
MRIVEQSSTRLVVCQRRMGMALLMGLFTLLSLLMLLNVLTQGLPRLLSAMNSYQILGWFIWLALAAGLVSIGTLMGVSAGQGRCCIFDKQSETVTLKRINWLRWQIITHSIYGVARAEVERNQDVRAFGIFLVLRSGERLALATLPLHDEDSAYSMVRTIRQFLHSHPG